MCERVDELRLVNAALSAVTVRVRVPRAMEIATEATAFLSQVLGKSVAEQAAAGNVEGWKVC